MDSHSSQHSTVYYITATVSLQHTGHTIGILFGKDAFDQLGCWLDYQNRMVNVKQLTTPLVLQKKKSEYYQPKYGSLCNNVDTHEHNFKLCFIFRVKL